MGALRLGLSWPVWGVFVRTVAVWHITWSVNSITHLWGYRNFPTRDNSRNNWVVGLISNGEGWHNNHHAEPRCASHGRRWWEVDLCYLSICALELSARNDWFDGRHCQRAYSNRRCRRISVRATAVALIDSWHFTSNPWASHSQFGDIDP